MSILAEEVKVAIQSIKDSAAGNQELTTEDLETLLVTSLLEEEKHGGK